MNPPSKRVVLYYRLTRIDACCSSETCTACLNLPNIRRWTCAPKWLWFFAEKSEFEMKFVCNFAIFAAITSSVMIVRSKNRNSIRTSSFAVFLYSMIQFTSCVLFKRWSEMMIHSRWDAGEPNLKSRKIFRRNKYLFCMHYAFSWKIVKCWNLRGACTTAGYCLKFLSKTWAI